MRLNVLSVTTTFGGLYLLTFNFLYCTCLKFANIVLSHYSDYHLVIIIIMIIQSSDWLFM